MSFDIFRLKITSAVVVEGVIKKAGEIVELAEREARDLLRREKAVVHAIEDEVKNVLHIETQPETDGTPKDGDASETVPEDAPAEPGADAGTVPPTSSRRK